MRFLQFGTTLENISDIRENVNKIYVDTRWYPWCGSCSNKKTVDRLKDYKLKCVEYKGGKCIICGYNKYYGALEFHHLDPSQKDFTIAGSNKSFDILKLELDKCVLLCATCHREVHGGLITLEI